MTDGLKMQQKFKMGKSISGKKGKKLHVLHQGKNKNPDASKHANEKTDKKFKKDWKKQSEEINVSVHKTKTLSGAFKDKHDKLKNRKKFKHAKALQNKQKSKSGKVNTQTVDHSIKTSGKNSKDKLSSEMGKKKKHKRKNKDKDGVKGNTVYGGVSSKSTGTSESQNNVTKDSPQKSEKKRLKILKWKQKQMAQKLARKGLTSKQIDKDKIDLPKTAKEATVNWRKLQETIESERGDSRKRKIPENRIRNPKHRKTENTPDDSVTDDQDTQAEKEPEIWFDDVDEILLDKKPVSMKQTADTGDEKSKVAENNPLVKPDAFKGVTKIVCMDCEMVGVGDGTDNMLARVSVVNQYGEPVYDKFVKPKEKVVDYRTFVSGIRPKDLKNAEEFEKVQQDVAEILKGKLLVGHAVKNDLKVLYLRHPRKRIRDTSSYKPFRQLTGGRTPSLKKLSEKVIGVKVQEGEHNSIQDAQATMRLYTMYRKQWEKELLTEKRERRQKRKKT